MAPQHGHGRELEARPERPQCQGGQLRRRIDFDIGMHEAFPFEIRLLKQFWT